MKKMQALFLLVACLLMGFSATLRAEDTDIYVNNAATAGTPNILLVIDTGASFSASADNCTYASGGSPTMNGSAGGIEQCALVDAIESLANGAVRIGVMVTNTNGFATDVRDPSDIAYHRTCSGSAGGCLVRALTLMDAAGKANLVNFIKAWKTSGSNSATEFNVKSSTTRSGGMMQEAWAYYNGKTGQSGYSYPENIIQTGCQKNFVIFIGNAYGNSGTPGDGTVSPFSDAYGLNTAHVGASAALKTKISTTITFNPATCGNTTSMPATTSTSDWSENWADEWARFMYQTDAGATTQENSQNIITYTIGVLSPALGNSCKPDYPALLSSMANNGGGKYFPTGDASALLSALSQILNEVQAVNSVFSSASLPVSVNAEGSYLNQIFLGMFRPDSTAAPRWVGNLKQYQLIRNSSGNLVLGDNSSPPQPAISSAGTGFISPVAKSFWTSKDTTRAPDDAATGGFFKNDMKGVPLSAYDSPDGEVVEKGGVGQQLRLESLTADFGTTAGSSTNPRRLYTYCPTGVTCMPGLTDASNEFSVANLGIGSTAFGVSSSIPVSSIKRIGTSATVTTSGNHGFVTGSSVTIVNANQSYYNVTQDVTVLSSTTFTITGLPDYPTTPSQGTYLISPGTTGAPIVSIVRGTSTTGGLNFETATVTTASAHGFTTASNLAIVGATESAYNRNPFNPTSVSTSSFTYAVAISPTAVGANTYQARFSSAANPAKTVTLKRYSVDTNYALGTTDVAHGFWAGQSVTVADATNNSKFSGTFTISAAGTTTFTYAVSGLGGNTNVGTVAPSTATKTFVVSRAATTTSALATATGLPAKFFGGTVAGATKTLNIVKYSGTATGETAYEVGDIVVTCVDADCTSFTYPITVTPGSSAVATSAGMTVGVAGSGTGSFNLPAGGITRTATSSTVQATATATVTGVTANTFTNGQLVNIGVTGSEMFGETGYLGNWTITCPASDCTTFTFGPVALTPTTPATGSSIQAYSGTVPPDRDTIIKWTRGNDNYNDEKGPGGTITVRPSIHGDVLHSRPLVVNYGDSRGIVAFYGSNDGIYRAINGNQSAAIGSVPAGGELWGLILPDHYDRMHRQRVNSPELKFPGTTLATARPKDYFVDGATGAYQKLNANGTTLDLAMIYLTMRRGGRFLYGLDVTQPQTPTVTFKISATTTGFEELGQTWSRPRATLLERQLGTSSPTPVLIFGAGYDPNQDSEPPGLDTMGRGIFIVNALDGSLIWSANKTCTTSATCRNVPDMKYAIPSDIAFVDRNANGFTDKLYFADLGGNVWRADVAATSSADWTVTRIAALGCDTDACGENITPRKFFFPPSVLSIRAGGTSGSYDAIGIPSGDREHPLKSTASGSAYNVNNGFFLVKDAGTSLVMDSTTVLPTRNVKKSDLDQITLADSVYEDPEGFYFNFATGEKAVNAPLAVNGLIFFATNRPTEPVGTTCASNLGEAKAYAVSPFTAGSSSNILPGGGLAPSAVTGLISFDTTNADGTTTTTQEKFCIGCGIGPPGGGCASALENCNLGTTIPKNLRRTYWYKK